METSFTPLYTVFSFGLPGCGLKTELENRLRFELGVYSKFHSANSYLGELCKEIIHYTYDTVTLHIDLNLISFHAVQQKCSPLVKTKNA